MLDQRRASGADRYDEVWDGVYRVTPLPNDEHQQIVSRLTYVFQDVIEMAERGDVRAGTNVSDRIEKWTGNFRIPDVAVFLRGGAAKCLGEFWHGGPDFLVEIVSSHDDTREKIPFYSKIGTREMLIVDRDPWSLELLRLDREGLRKVGRSDLANSVLLVSEVTPFSFRLLAGSPRPVIEVRSTESGKVWLV